MRILLHLVFLGLVISPSLCVAQRDSSRIDFADAEAWLQFEEYAEAAALYQKLLYWYPDNHNLKYKIGICLLNDPYRKQESIAYLQAASGNINPNYKVGSFKETAAPPDVLYILGNAYLVNEELDAARKSYESFLEIMDPAIYDDALVKAQIQACENARKFMSDPVDIDIRPVSQKLNTSNAETHPVLSGDGKRMAYISEEPFFDEALFIEMQADGSWSPPISLTSMLGFDQDIYPVAMNYDGTEMLLYYDDEHIGNIYHSRYEDGFWQPAEILGENISTKFWESHASFSRDGKQLYFTSNRKGGWGGLDIYVSQMEENGKWGKPQNLGLQINTPYNEECPFLTEDGNTLFFSSYGHTNMGGYDIFYATRESNGKWSKPVNLGFPINTTDNDVFLHPVNNGRGAYQSRLEKDSKGRFDIYYMDIYSASNPRIYQVFGSVRTEDIGTEKQALQLTLLDGDTGDTLRKAIPIGEDGSFRLDLGQGNYELHAGSPGYLSTIVPLAITRNSNKQGIRLSETIELHLIPPEPVLVHEVDSLGEITDTAVLTQEATDPEESPGEVALTIPDPDTGSREDQHSETTVTEQESTLVETDEEDGSGEELPAKSGKIIRGDKAWLLYLILGGGILLLILLWFRRRKKSE